MAGTEAGKRRGSLTRIAAELGVSAKTVSNAFSRPDQLSVELRERILETARRMDYAGPDPVARAFRRGRTGMVGVLYANPLSYAFADPAAVGLLAGLSEVLEVEDVGLSLISGSAGTARSAEGLGRAVVDGVVAYSLSADDPALDAVRQRGLPAVMVDQPRLPDRTWVGIDDRARARDVAARLIAAGHRRIGVVSFGMDGRGERGLFPLAALPPITLQVTARRLSGYADAIAPSVDPARIPVARGTDSTPAEGRIGAAALLDARPDLTALICLSDQLAVGAIAELERRGMSVPHDVSIVGFDGTFPARADGLTLVSIRQPHATKGRHAARHLIAAIAGDEPVTITLDCEPVDGNSVAPPRG
ncbi:MAG TPA: LacI family DNA-binding transcriptional regulator [Thermomicrobiales bacterium]|jgi:DNA-binding LacI/PurR family transcriptional regulator|nr:LacI family DNA-binding transcriptional regulator [Thermomicrobiales bacterium]